MNNLDKRILEITKVYDNNGETYDRYTVFTPDGAVYGMSEGGEGFNQYIGDYTEVEMGEHLGTKLDSVPESIKNAVLNRMVDSQFVDLFQYFELMPENVSAIFDMYYEMSGGDWDYDNLSKLQEELKELGYTFDYGLDAEPYGLRPIELSLNQLKDFEEYKNGGSIYNKGRSWHLDRQKHNKSESWEKPMRKRKKRYETGGGVGDKQVIEFEYKGKNHKFSFVPDEPDMWTSFESHGLVFDVHYDEDYNEIVVYKVIDNEAQLEKSVYSKSIMKNGGGVDDKLNMLKEELEKKGVYVEKSLDIEKTPYLEIYPKDDFYLTNNFFFINKSGKYEMGNRYWDGTSEQSMIYDNRKSILEYVDKNSFETIQERQAEKDRIEAEKSKWLSPYERFKKNKYTNGGGINSGRDALFKSQEPHEQRYKRKREWKEYKKEGWFGDWFRDGGSMDDYTKSLGMVRVKFADPKYNYETNVSGSITEEQARNYFVGKMFDVGTYPNENMQKVIDIDFYPKGTYELGGNIGNEEEMVKSNLYNGEISCEKLTEIIGCKPNYPYQIVGAIKLEKCYLRPYYKLV